MLANRKRRQRSNHGSMQQNFIDQQILDLHKAIAEKLLASPELINKVKITLNERYENGTMHYGAFLTWNCLLEQINDKGLFLKGMLDNSDTMRKYRRKTPFIGILNEQERQQALNFSQ